MKSQEFSFKTREESLKAFRTETFDLLIIGGGITGAGTARDAASRGLKVALVEKNDFAWGTSSRSSKLIHGGLRYLQNMELGLVFEALSERSHLLKTVPHMVRPLTFFMPVYKGDSFGRFLLSIALSIYDVLSLFRAPGFHKRFSRKDFLKQIPFIREEGLQGGFRYYDASMWDDVLAVETLRAASTESGAIVNYAEATAPIWENEQVVGFQIRDLESPNSELINLRAKKTIVCAGPWTDQVGAKLSNHWHRWLNPSKGVHLLFDLKRIPLPGALVMNHPGDGRIAFVIPRPDYGSGVVIVGTTDGPTPLDPEKASIDPSDVDYLMKLLQRYFPSLNLTDADILSAYVGVRPLMGTQSSTTGSEGQPKLEDSAEELQKVSREHYIGSGPGGTVLVAGGKYTTHRLMAREIVDFSIKKWQQEALQKKAPAFPENIMPSQTDAAVNPMATEEAIANSRKEAEQKGWKVPEALWNRYGAEALEIIQIHLETPQSNNNLLDDPEGFPYLEAQLRYAMRTEMVLHLQDFYLRRVGLYATRQDHGLPWAERLAKVWAQELGFPESSASQELKRLQDEIADRDSWKKELP